MKIVLLFCGILSFCLGIIGIFLPLLPTTPFILLAAFFFARSSEKFHAWLRSHPQFGEIVKDWEDQKTIRRSTKWRATIAITILFPLSLFFLRPPLFVNVLSISIVVVVLFFIWTRNEIAALKSPDRLS